MKKDCTGCGAIEICTLTKADKVPCSVYPDIKYDKRANRDKKQKINLTRD